MIFDKFFKKTGQQEAKSYSLRDLSLLSVLKGDFSYNRTEAQQFINYYIESSPVYTANKLISDAASSITPVVYDMNREEIIYNHPVLELLKRPNPFTDQKLFFKELYAYFNLTGNCYLNIIGTNKPAELEILNPASITVRAANDGYAGQYEYNNNSSNYIYTRDADKRFLDSRNNELIHLRDFNPEYCSNNLVGYSCYVGVQLEISQYIQASIHNDSLLKNQARPSGLLTYKGDMAISDDQVSQIKEMLSERLSGATNAGKTTFLNGHFDYKQLSESIKDMDFPTLKKQTAETIYNAAKIPLPMVSPDNMTLANMDAAKYNFYDNNILPLSKRVFSFLTKSLMPRYSRSDNLIITYDESSIEALQNRKTQNTINQYKEGLITRNEARTDIGRESIGQEGDIFYQPMNLIPVGNDAFTSDNRESPTKSIQNEEYARLLSNMKKLDGSRMYSDEFIKQSLENL